MRTGIVTAAVTVLLAVIPAVHGQQASSTPENPKATSETKPTDQKDPGKPAPPNASPSTAIDNPFPEAQSAAAAKQAKRETAPAAGQPANGNASPGLALQPIPGSSSSNQSMSDDDLGGATITYRKHQDEFTRDLNPAGRLKDDLNVADLYMKDWNYRGAYMRYKDALQQDDINEAAIFGAGKAACMLNNFSAATAQLTDYLNLYPTGKNAREAKEILDHPKKCAGNH
jgi:hypothetical protein